jgi:hypothetical protein
VLPAQPRFHPTNEESPAGIDPAIIDRWSPRRLARPDASKPIDARCRPRTFITSPAARPSSEVAELARIPADWEIRSATPLALPPNSDPSNPLPVSTRLCEAPVPEKKPAGLLSALPSNLPASSIRPIWSAPALVEDISESAPMIAGTPPVNADCVAEGDSPTKVAAF